MNYFNSINVEKLLKDMHIPYKIVGQNARIKCFNPEHKENKPSLSVHLETGIYYCFGCHIKGNILGFVKNKLDLKEDEVFQYINQETKGGSTEEEVFSTLKETMRTRGVITQKDVVIIELPTKDITHDYYMQDKRGFTLQELQKWGIKKVDCPGKKWHNWIYVPIYYKGKLRTWFLRSPFGSDKIYGYHLEDDKESDKKVVVGYPRSDILFGLDSIPSDVKSLYVFEGIFDKIWFEKTRNHAVAALSNRLSSEQLSELVNFDEIILGLDNDDPSFELALNSLVLIQRIKRVMVWTPPIDKKDANECTLEELLEQTYKIVPLTKFIETERFIQWSLKRLHRRA
jgi:DNA primase